MSASKLFAVFGVVGFAVAIVVGLLPVTTTVSVSYLPGGVEAVARLLNGPVGLDVNVGGETLRVNCGSLFFPTRHRFEASNWLSDQLQVAERAEDAVNSSCDEARAQRGVILLTAGGLGGIFFVVSLVGVLIRPQQPRRRIAEQAGVPAGSPPHVLVRTAPSPPVAPLRTASPLERHPLRWAGALGVVLAVAALLIFFTTVRRGGGGSARGATADLVDSAERACITSAIERSNDEVDRGLALAREDSSRAVVNLDGNSSYEDLAARLRSIDLSGCPGTFRTAYAAWAEAWRYYGEFHDEAARPHAPWNGQWSKANARNERCRLINALQESARQVAAAARGAGVQEGISYVSFDDC